MLRSHRVTLRGLHLLPVTMFLGSFAWSFVYVSLPFYIQRISAFDPATTLQWTGWVLGVPALVTVATAPLWGRFAERGDPRRLYVLVEFLQGVAFFGMALARTVPELFLARFVLGFMGAASTFAFMIVGRLDDPGVVRRHVAAIQSAMTIGQVVGPLAGAIAAARLGFRSSFLLGGLILIGCAALVRWGVPALAPRRRDARAGGRASLRDVASVAVIVLGGSIHIFFLTAILPQVLPDLGVPPERTLEVGGLVIFASGAATALGAVVAPRLGEWLPERRLIPGLLVGSSLSVAALGAAATVWGYGVLRFLQVLFVAPVFPIVVARIAHRASGQAIGVINSARIAAGFLGPVVATSVVAWTSAATLYLLLAAIGLACVPLAHRAPREGFGGRQKPPM
jgi:DHA1 family multidrug resistance protein-like MFS transporter